MNTIMRLSVGIELATLVMVFKSRLLIISIQQAVLNCCEITFFFLNANLMIRDESCEQITFKLFLKLVTFIKENWNLDQELSI